MKIVGVIGPYFNGGDRRLIDYSITDARFVGIKIATYFGENKFIGFFIPHNHTAMFEQLASAPRAYYHALNAVIYNKACDGFILLPDWDTSSDSRHDYDQAVAQGKMIFKLGGFDTKNINLLLKHLEEWSGAPPAEKKKAKIKEKTNLDKKRKFLFDAGFAALDIKGLLPETVNRAADELNGKKVTLRKAVEKIQAATASKVTIKDDWIVIEVKDGPEVTGIFKVIRFK